MRNKNGNFLLIWYFVLFLIYTAKVILFSSFEGVSVRILRPPNYMMYFMLLAGLVTVAGLAYIKRDSLEFMYQRTTWACIVIAFILVMMSGQMWNQIRGAGFAHQDPRTGQVVRGIVFSMEHFPGLFLHAKLRCDVFLLGKI